MDFKGVIWNNKTYNELIKYLNSLSSSSYKDFNKKIVNSKYEVLGVSVPVLKKLAKELSKTDYKSLLKLMKFNSYEEVILAFLIISNIKDYKEATNYLKEYVTYIDSWGVTDTFASSFKIVKKNKQQTLSLIDELIKDEYTFSKRLGYILLLDYYIDREHLRLIFDYIKKEESKEYYVQMAISWLLSVMYVKYTNETYDFLKDSKLDDFVVRKTVSKVQDSFRVSKEDKERIKTILKDM